MIGDLSLSSVGLQPTDLIRGKGREPSFSRSGLLAAIALPRQRVAGSEAATWTRLFEACEKIEIGLDKCGVSFETAAWRPPQDEGFFLDAIKSVPRPEERPKGRLEGRTTVMPPLKFDSFTRAFLRGDE